MIMEQYLQIYYSYLQNDWEKWLLLAEFTINNTINKSIGVMLFYTTYKQDPCLKFKL
jgi:hypothetical protein